ncbi:type II secretion system secretin GspD [Fontisubflavum oceani]|uniref:type II secretion system secretin GspD n=1 Tax=Fontisubflavum oceani TaxID=2978973 RepID=UPI0025B505D8|nr:type II secretion system secretin GspD [Fontisubflavum oceani]WJY20387.1 type II secretion system secretin GspD [Fontisubflavum oceani]
MSKSGRFPRVGIAIVSLFLAACGSESNQSTSPLLANQTTRGNDNANSSFATFSASLNGRSGDRRALGTGEFLGQPGGQSTRLIAASDDGSFSLNLVNVPISQAANAVLGEALERSFTVSPDVSGAITLQTTRPLSEADLLETFQTVLELNGATLEQSGDLVTIVPLSGAPQRIGVLGDPSAIDARTVAVPLQHIGTAEMIRLLAPIAGPSVGLQPIPSRGILLVSGSRGEINAAIEAINLFDVDVLSGKSVGLFRLSAAEPEAVVGELNEIFETGAGGSLEDVVTFIPSQRLGAIIVVTSRGRYLSEAERWIRDLDRAAGGIQRRPVVYALQNRDAVDLAPVLTEMLAQDSAEGTPTAGIGSARIVADDTNNSIVVWGNDTEQEAFARLIQSLDTPPVQVLLEATIAEVSLNDQLNFGLRWFFENGDLRGTFSDASNGAVAATFPGLSFTFQGASAAVAINALSSITDVNVVSSPSILVLDNQEARLQIGDEVPIATQQVRDVSDPASPIVNTISFRDTGIILTVRPRVSESGRVILDIEQEVSSVSTTTTSGIDSPTISQRRIDTSVSILNGQTIALGGLIEESRNRTNSRVPVAGEIPVLGALFRNRSDRTTRTELLILITPRGWFAVAPKRNP